MAPSIFSGDQSCLLHSSQVFIRPSLKFQSEVICPNQQSGYLRHVQVWTLVIRDLFTSRLKLTTKMAANVFSATHMYFGESPKSSPYVLRLGLKSQQSDEFNEFQHVSLQHHIILHILISLVRHTFTVFGLLRLDSLLVHSCVSVGVYAATTVHVCPGSDQQCADQDQLSTDIYQFNKSFSNCMFTRQISAKCTSS